MSSASRLPGASLTVQSHGMCWYIPVLSIEALIQSSFTAAQKVFPQALLRYWSPTRTSFETGKFLPLSDLPKMPRKEREILENCNFPISIFKCRKLTVHRVSQYFPQFVAALYLCVPPVSVLFWQCTGLSVCFPNPCFRTWSSLWTSTQKVDNWNSRPHQQNTL